MLALHLTALALAVWWLRAPEATALRILPPPTPTPAPTPTAVLLWVDVTGAVVSPDVVRVPEGARARDAIQAAGGFTAEAERSAVNLAAPLTDGSQLYVPLRGEAPPRVAAVVAPALPGSGVAAGSAARLNLNTATAAELEALPGIGPALAERIVAYRGEHGPFRDAKALTEVPGIGEKLLARLVERVTVR